MFTSSDGALVADVRTGVLWGWLDLLLELESINEALAMIEQQSESAHVQSVPELEDARQRTDLMRMNVLGQLRALLSWQETIH